ncbi:hypothetical protein ABT127_18230 [Streptomyces sp. NPDC001904]|uniref:hypothetical protein n=1 Tax=Streptomyces sp. NPDC001904 TaxID=3154531 RepID=UPI003324F1F2
MRLLVAAVIGSALTVVLMGCLWGTLAEQPGVLSTFVENSTRLTEKAIEEQAGCLSGELTDCR